VKTKEHAMACYPANPVGWGHVIKVLWMIVTKEDLERLARYCNKNSRHFNCTRDYYLYKNWKCAFIGKSKYHMIWYGISGLHDHEREEDDPYNCFEVDDNTGG
jgi:hypothetical protein